MISALDASVFCEIRWLLDCVAFRDNDNPIKLANETILGRGYGTIGVERASLLFIVNQALELQTLLPDARIVVFTGITWEMRQVNSPLELARPKVAADVCDRATVAGVLEGFAIVAVGDLIVTRPVTKGHHRGFGDIVEILRDTDVTFGNMEANIFDVQSLKGGPQAEYGGAYPVSCWSLGLI
ncbi:hypothetical protein [Mesorhizobium sangaii]|uniref:Aminoacyl-transfer RNA synthetases class-II family profile domain-containing protein n=1 Tax=Mesorhizobium sangaii TaxID=505389 RepID=A0A841PEW7_9HYPH|nr:hypothetical protein [Mesorhizobium sangaii]